MAKATAYCLLLIKFLHTLHWSSASTVWIFFPHGWIKAYRLLLFHMFSAVRPGLWLTANAVLMLIYRPGTTPHQLRVIPRVTCSPNRRAPTLMSHAAIFSRLNPTESIVAIFWGGPLRWFTTVCCVYNRDCKVFVSHEQFKHFEIGLSRLDAKM